MSEQITVLRDLQREYIEKRNHCFTLIRKQDNDLRNCAPSASLIRECRDREDALRADAAQHQKRIDAIQKKLDEAIGLTDE